MSRAGPFSVLLYTVLSTSTASSWVDWGFLNSLVCDTIDKSSPAAGVEAAAGVEVVFGAGVGAEVVCCAVSEGLEQAVRRVASRIGSRGFMMDGERAAGGLNKRFVVIGWRLPENSERGFQVAFFGCCLSVVGAKALGDDDINRTRAVGESKVFVCGEMTVVFGICPIGAGGVF